jgi:RNA polymerase sigma factor (sigma-70 family)
MRDNEDVRMDMRDSEVVASVVAGDPEGLAIAYDRYADPLYKYCRALLRGPDDAAESVQDTFAIASSRLGGLRDPAELRAWLFAVARNESPRIARTAMETSPLPAVPDVSDERADAGEAISDGELRTLFDRAAEGLDPGDREVIELRLRQGLEPAEVASVLGVSRHHAHSLLSRAQAQLEASLAVLIVGRAGRGECGALVVLLADWNGHLTAALRQRVYRHIERCAACSASRDLELRPDMLGLPPAAALATGAAVSFQLTAGVPAELKAQTIALATGRDAGTAAHRAAVLSRVGAFGRTGFPTPARGAAEAGFAAHHDVAGGVRAVPRFSPRGRAAVAVAVVLAVLIAAVAFTLAGKGGSAGPTAELAPTDPASGPVQASPADALTKPTATAAAGTSPAPTATAAAASRTSTRASASTSVAATPTTRAAGSATATASSAPSPTSATPSASPASRGTLTMTPQGGLLLVGAGGKQIVLSANGGAVSWSATIANDGNGAVEVSPSAGTLTAAGASVTVTVTVSHLVSCLATSYPTITIHPGGTQYYACSG